MSSTALELKPDRLLMDSNFDGYKLSLEELKTFRKPLPVPLYKTFLKSSQYSLLHAKLFGLHNHLFADPFDGFASVYFVDEQFNIRKVYVDNGLVDPITVFTMKKNHEKTSGDYNVSLKFATCEYAVASDGMGNLYILATNDKRDDDDFSMEFCGKALSNEEQGFIISDAVFSEAKNELHILILHIEEDADDRFKSVIHWLTFKESADKVWGQVALRRLYTKSEVQYLSLEKNCEHLYVVAEHPVSFELNSEHAIIETEKLGNGYKWAQTSEKITVRIALKQSCEEELVKVSSENSKLNITYNNEVLLEGDLERKADFLTWKVENGNLEVTLAKSERNIAWKELILGDERGEYLEDINKVDVPNESLKSFTTDSEALPQSGTTFNSQQIEECDFESDKSRTFERISGITNKATHKIHLGSHQVILSNYLMERWPPMLGIRHDVDVCIWQPVTEGEDFLCKHEGTLLAFGYVQASKTNRKFVTCSPNLDYSVVSESSGHVFIYRQNKPLLAAELRHRVSGRRIKKVAQQQVFSLPNQDVLGIFAGNNHLFLLGNDFIVALEVNPDTTE